MSSHHRPAIVLLSGGLDSATCLAIARVSGYTPIGGAITGPRNSTQTTFEIGDGASWSHGRHLVKVGGELRHTSIDMFQAIAPNAFYVFAGTFPTNNAIANLLTGDIVLHDPHEDVTGEASWCCICDISRDDETGVVACTLGSLKHRPARLVVRRDGDGAVVTLLAAREGCSTSRAIRNERVA